MAKIRHHNIKRRIAIHTTKGYRFWIITDCKALFRLKTTIAITE